MRIPLFAVAFGAVVLMFATFGGERAARPLAAAAGTVEAADDRVAPLEQELQAARAEIARARRDTAELQRLAAVRRRC